MTSDRNKWMVRAEELLLAGIWGFIVGSILIVILLRLGVDMSSRWRQFLFILVCSFAAVQISSRRASQRRKL